VRRPLLLEGFVLATLVAAGPDLPAPQRPKRLWAQLE
jgi:hypothetical protein